MRVMITFPSPDPEIKRAIKDIIEDDIIPLRKKNGIIKNLNRNKDRMDLLLLDALKYYCDYLKNGKII